MVKPTENSSAGILPAIMEASSLPMIASADCNAGRSPNERAASSTHMNGSTDSSAGILPAVMRASCPHNATRASALPNGRESCPKPSNDSASQSDHSAPSPFIDVPRLRYGEVTVRDRGRLPHWTAGKATYFVTFRLADALPRSVADSYRFEGEDIIERARQQGRELSASERKRLGDLFSERIEAYLDAGSGGCFLARNEVAEVVANAFRHFDGVRYRLFAWCIMPNHVHVVLRPMGGWGLGKVVHSWKSFSAKKVNSLLGRRGSLWQREYYDHLVRDEADFARVVTYVVENPRKAGLGEWLWVWADETCWSSGGEGADEIG